MNSNLWNLRVLHSVPDLEKFVDLEIAVWGLDPRDAVPTSLLHAMALNGALVLGAYDHDDMVGMAFAFPVPRGNKLLLWSHMAGVRPDYQGKGIGFALKQFQRNWALEQGYREIGWTFDPLQRGNANFNLHDLGAASQTYYVNLYGEMTDGINAGLPSDRLEVIWDLRQKRVQQLAKSIPDSISLDGVSDSHFLLRADDNHEPEIKSLSNPLLSFYLIEIPPDLPAVKRGSLKRALNWRLALRQALETAFAAHYRATDFLTIEGRCCYVLTPPQFWFLYVLECADQTLYTGITPDLQKRLKKHNSMKGAAYTAARLPVRLIGAWQFGNRSEALKAEVAFKKHSRQKKLAFVSEAMPYRDAPFVPIDGE